MFKSIILMIIITVNQWFFFYQPSNFLILNLNNRPRYFLILNLNHRPRNIVSDGKGILKKAEGTENE